MKPGRFPGRLLIFTALIWRLLSQWRRRKPQPQQIQRVLILHQFLLGDALMATSLLAKARAQFPNAEILLACPPLQAPLYQNQPYGVTALAWQPRDFASIWRLFCLPRFDAVYLIGENRLGFLARAIGARWIVGFAAEQPHYKNWLLDEAIPYSHQAESWTDTAASLIDGPEPAVYDPSQWPIEETTLPDLPSLFVVLHVGASSPTRFWPASYWQQLAQAVRQQGLTVVWSCGPNEQALIQAIKPQTEDGVINGHLSLVQLRALLERAQACVCPDTGIAHLAKIAGTPLVMLFGPGSPTLFGTSRFFARHRCIEVGPAWFPCRSQRDMHYRPVDWVLRCWRKFGSAEGACQRAQCMEAVLPTSTITALSVLLLKEDL